jgi:hypothetical protein
MEKINYYSSEEAYRRAMADKGVILPSEQDISNPDVPLTEAENPSDGLTDEQKGEQIAKAIQMGVTPTFEQAMLFRKWKDAQVPDAWNSVSEAFTHTVGALAEGAYELGKDVVTLQPQKIVGSAIEGAALGTKNWLYMYEQAKFDEHSWLHKLMFNTHANDQEYYWNLKQSVETNKMIKKDAEEGIFVPNSIKIGGMELDLTNPAVVQAVSFVADPSWLMPNLGIESALAKGLSGASRVLALNEQLTKASVFATKKLGAVSESLAKRAEKTASLIERTETRLEESFKNMTNIDASLTTGGKPLYGDTLVRGAVEPIGGNNVRIPAWGVTQMVWGGAKVTQAVGEVGQLAFKLLGEQSEIAGMRLSERIAMESTNKTVKNLASTWSRVASPFVEYALNTTKTSLHSAMYGGAFGIVFGGEEGFYNGLGTGFALGGAFHHIGLAHGAVAGANAIPDTIKNFLWSTSHMDYFNQEGISHFLAETEKDSGAKGKLRAMSDIAGIERLARGERRLYLREERIKELLSNHPESWASYEKLLADPDWGGVAFHKTETKENITIVNVDRASKSAFREEFFHTMLLGRYAEAFKKSGVDALIGTDDKEGALYRMPREDAVRLLTQFKDSYLKLDSSVKGSIPEKTAEILKDFDLAIEQLKRGEKPQVLRTVYEEFLASYWNRFIEDKPLDYLLNGGDLGVVRNTIQWAKDVYLDVMHKDLTSAGANFKWGENPDHFFIEQNTKQRIRIPELEKLMKHFVKEVGKNRYKGWEKGKATYSDVGSALNLGLGHLFNTPEGQEISLKSQEIIDKEHSDGVLSALDKIDKLPKEQRGLQFSFSGGRDNENSVLFSPAKRKKIKKPKAGETERLPSTNEERAYWQAFERRINQRKRQKLEEEAGVSVESTINSPDIEEAQQIAEEHFNKDESGWSMFRSQDGFWRSEWEGNPRLKITGKATEHELDILAEYLPSRVVETFRDLNNVIETSRFIDNTNVSNVLRAEILTATREDEQGNRKVSKGGREERRIERNKSDGEIKTNRKIKGFYIRNSKFVPAEINLSFARFKDRKVNGEQTYKVGDAKLIVTSIDMDALVTRIDYSWDEMKERGGIDYKRVRKLFGSKQNLMEAVKRLLENYSKGQKAEAGAELFRGEEGSIREAQDKRDIVNAVIGFHPTQKMLEGGSKRIERAGGNYPLKMQLSSYREIDYLPTVMTNFRVDRIGDLRAFPLEGFKYNHDNAYVRSQFNYSPSVSRRDHEGNLIPTGVHNSLGNTVYRNKEGEIITVYNLDKQNSIIRKNAETDVHTYVDETLSQRLDKVNPFLRGGSYESLSGWMHFTPDGAEAGFSTDSRLKTGWIDTQRHIDISQLDAKSPLSTTIDLLSKRMAEITGESEVVLKERLLQTKVNGTKLGELYNEKTRRILDVPTEQVETWLFSKETIPFFRKYGIHSIEYNSVNHLNGNQYSSIAMFDGSRFIENRSRANDAQKFSFSPSSPLKAKLQSLISKVGHERAFLDYVLNEDGEYVPNTRKVTQVEVDRIIQDEHNRLKQAQERIEKNKPFGKKEREQYIETLKPFVLSALRKEFVGVPNKVLEQIANLSLTGYQLERIQGKGPLAPLVIKESVFIREAKRYGITGERIRKTGIPSLGHWAEMTEKEYAMFKIHKEFEAFLNSKEDKERGAHLEFLTRPENKEYAEGILKYNGWAGFMDELGTRGRDLLFITDSEIIKTRAIDSKAPFPFVLDSKAIKEVFAKKTQAFITQTLQSGKMNLKQRSSLLNIRKGYDDIMSARMLEGVGDEFSPFYSNVKDAQDLYDSYSRAIEDIISAEAKHRIDDMLTAYHIEESDPELIKAVRTTLYDMANKGLVKLGTPEAVQKAVEIYASLNNANKKKVIDIQTAINKNYEKALRSMEEKGFYGTVWQETPNSTHTYTTGRRISGTKMWKFDGAGYYIIERPASSYDVLNEPNRGRTERLLFGKDTETSYRGSLINKNLLELYDPLGNRIYQEIYELQSRDAQGELVPITDIERADILKQFQRRSSHHLDINTYAQSIFSGGYTVEGTSKEFILRSLLQDAGKYYPDIHAQLTGEVRASQVDVQTTSEQAGDMPIVSDEVKSYLSIQDFSNWELYNNKGTYLAIRRNDAQTVSQDLKVNRTFIKTRKGASKGNGPAVETRVELANKTTVQEQIANLEAYLKQNRVIAENRWLSLDEKIALREQLARLKAVQYEDKGIVFQFDTKLSVVIPDEWRNINTVEKRMKALEALKGGTLENVAFHEHIKNMYERFNQELEGTVKPKIQKRIKRVLSEGPEGNIAKLKALEAQLLTIRKEQNDYLRSEKTASDEAQKKKGSPPKDIKSIINEIKRRKKNAQQLVLDNSSKRTIIRQRLIDLGMLEGWDRLSEGEKTSHYDEYQYLKDINSAQKWMSGLEQDGSMNNIQYVKFLKEKLAETEDTIARGRKVVEDYEANVETKSEVEEEIKGRMMFLLDQYSRAQGKRFKIGEIEKFLGEILTKDQVVLDKFGDKIEGITQYKINYDKLRRSFGKKNITPEYFPDRDGLTTKGNLPERVETIDQYVEAFKEGIMQIRDRYVNAGTNEDVGYKYLMTSGRDFRDSTPNLEIPYSGRLRSVLTRSNFTKSELVWINSPENFKTVQSLESQWRDNLLSDNDFVNAVKDASELTHLGPDGVNFISTETRLKRVNSEIADRISELRSLTHISRRFNGTDIISVGDNSLMVPREYEIPEMTQRHLAIVREWRNLVKRKVALETRLDAIMASADSGNAHPELQRIIAERKLKSENAKRVVENMRARDAQIAEWKAQFAKNAEELFKRYDERARQLGFTDSRVVIRPNDVYAQGLMLAFPSLTHDFFPKAPELNWSLAENTEIIGASAGWTDKGELHFVPRGSTEKNVINAEKDMGYYRTVYIADYISRIEQWVNYHLDPKNADIAMTPEQALAIERFFPEYNNHIGFVEKKKQITARQIGEVMDTINGIRDNLSSKTNRDRFIRTFVYEALNLIKGNQVMKEDAFKRLKNIPDDKFEEMRATMSADDFAKMLNSKEILERCLYLVANKGRLYASQNNPFNYIGNAKGEPIYKVTKEEKTVTTRGEAPAKGVKGKITKQGKVVKETKELIPFRTGGQFGIPVDVLIRMDGFDKIWQSEVIDKAPSAFEGTPFKKIAYEKIPLEERISKTGSAITKIMAENEAGMIERQRQEAVRRGAENKPIWGPDYGVWYEKESERVQSYINTVGQVEASLIRLKGDLTTFIKTRPKALQNLLSINDGLAFSNLDFSDVTQGHWRESNDGRYIIKKDGDGFKVYFIGENVVNADGAKVMQIPTSEIASVKDLTQARVMVRFFNDDISRIHHTAKLVGGGSGNNPWNVLGENIPAMQSGELIRSFDYIPDFAKSIISVYEESRGKPTFQEQMIRSFQEIGQYGEPQFIKVNENGVPTLGQVVIIPNEFNTVTPLQERQLEQTHTRGINEKGDVVWTPKEKTYEPSSEPAPTATENKETSTTTADNPEPTDKDKTISNSTHWDIVSNLPPAQGQMFAEWGTLRNRLNYTLVKIKLDKKTNAYRLFNPASGFMGGYANERDAVDAVLKEEFKQKYGTQ